MANASAKGLFNAEYIAVLVLFIGFSTYFTFRLMQQQPAYVAEVQKETFRSESYRLVEMLVDDAGSPANWESGGTVNRVGLSDETKNVTNLVSDLKITRMEQMCVGALGYANVKALVGAQHDFSIVRINSSSQLERVCNGTIGDVKATITRLVAFTSGDYGKIVLQMW